MKIQPLLESSFSEMTLNYVRERGFEDSIRDDGAVKVYHGSSVRNIKSISDSGVFRGFPFFALEESTAYRFAQQVGGKPHVMVLWVDPDSILPTGEYLTARQEGMHLDTDGVWRL